MFAGSQVRRRTARRCGIPIISRRRRPISTPSFFVEVRTSPSVHVVAAACDDTHNSCLLPSCPSNVCLVSRPSNDLPRRTESWCPSRTVPPEPTDNQRSARQLDVVSDTWTPNAGRSCSQINSFVVGVKSQTSSTHRFSCFRLHLPTVYCHPVFGTDAIFVSAGCMDQWSPQDRKMDDNAATG